MSSKSSSFYVLDDYGQKSVELGAGTFVDVEGDYWTPTKGPEFF